MKNWRKFGLAQIRPSGPVSAAKNPITNEPLMFTNKVPAGNVSPNFCAIAPEIQKRPTDPSAPPIATQIAKHENFLTLGRASGVISAETVRAVFPNEGRQTPLPAQLVSDDVGN